MTPRDDLPARRRPHLPGHRHLRLHDGARERAGRAALACAASWVPFVSSLPAHFRKKQMQLLEQVGMRDAGRAPLRGARLRRPEARRTRGGARQPPAPAADGRTDRRHGAGGARRADEARRKASRREAGIAVLFTEHDMDVVFGHADRVIVLADGELIAQGTPAEVRADRAGAPRLPRRGGRPCLNSSGVNAGYGRAQILFDFDLELRAGEVVALLGRNGAGKIDHAEGRDGPAAALFRRDICFDRTANRHARTLPDRAPRPGLRAGGPAHLHRPDA